MKTVFPASILVPAGRKKHFDQTATFFCIKSVVYQIGNFLPMICILDIPGIVIQLVI
jgi:hypothetical protein